MSGDIVTFPGPESRSGTTPRSIRPARKTRAKAVPVTLEDKLRRLVELRPRLQRVLDVMLSDMLERAEQQLYDDSPA